MIASLDGVVTSIGPDSVVLKVAGVGYRVACGPGRLRQGRCGSQKTLV